MKFGRYTLIMIPAIIFWAASMRFFIMGMSIDDTSGEMYDIAIGLAIATTIIQVVGNGFSRQELGPIVYYGWIMSYVLGVASNFYALTLILNIPMKYVEYAIAISLGSMIEFMPEKMFVMFWRSTFPYGFAGFIKGIFNFGYSNRSNRSNQRNYSNDRGSNNKSNRSSDGNKRFITTSDGRKFEVPPRPSGMARAEYRKYLQEYFEEKGIELEFQGER